MPPEHKIYLEVRKVLDRLFKPSFYDSRPAGEVNYPFCFLGEQFKQNDRIHKDYLNGSTQITIHFYHNNDKERGALQGMVTQTEQALLGLFGGHGEQIDTQIINENTTGVELLHGILEININY